MATTGHTAGRLIVREHWEGVRTLESESDSVAVVNSAANAARLAIAWNAHDELVAALTEFMLWQRTVQELLPDGLLDRAEAALRSATA